MATEHDTITDPKLHEPKGVAAAAADKVYVSDGAGSGTWKKIAAGQIDATSVFNANKSIVVFTFTDVSTGADMYVVIPKAMTVTKIWSVIDGALGTADAVLTFANHAGGSMGDITITQSGSAAGDVDSLLPASNNTFTAGQHMKITSNGASANTVNAQITLELTQTA